MGDISLTIDEIHAIREEHSKKTKDMSFDKYKELLDTEIAPTLLALARAKKLKKDRTENGTSPTTP